MPAAHHAHRKMTAAQRAAEEWGFAERTIKGEDAVDAKKATVKNSDNINVKPIVLHATEKPKTPVVKHVEAAKAQKTQAVKAPAVKAVHTNKPKTHTVVAQKKATGNDGGLLEEAMDPWHMF
jgi:hypothetical protein